MQKIIFYTTNCPKCQVLKKKLDSLNIKYQICGDVDIMEQKGIRSVPILEIETDLLDFSRAVKWLKEYEKNEY